MSNHGGRTIVVSVISSLEYCVPTEYPVLMRQVLRTAGGSQGSARHHDADYTCPRSCQFTGEAFRAGVGKESRPSNI